MIQGITKTTQRQQQEKEQEQQQQRCDPIGIEISAELSSFDYWQKYKSSLSSSLRPCHDGHTPEGLTVDNTPADSDSLRGRNDPSSSCQRIHYDTLTEESIPIIHVTDHAVNPNLCQAWYDAMSRDATTETAPNNTAGKSNGRNNKSWGTYVTLSEIYDYWEQQQQKTYEQRNEENDSEQRPEDAAVAAAATRKATTTPTNTHTATTGPSQQEYRHGLAVAVAARLVQQAWNLESDSSSPTRSYTTVTKATTATLDTTTSLPTIDATVSAATTIVTTEYNNNEDSDTATSDTTIPPMPDWWRRRNAHGVAVWALISSQGMAVPYHMDYAEQVRYASNIIATPLWGGILHCTPSSCSSSSQNEEGNAESIEGGDYFVYLQSPESSWEHYQRHGYKSQLRNPNEENRITIPYRTNRLIAQAGYLPHGSTAVTALMTGVKGRVVVGLNVFGADVGRIVQALPEHSPQFNAWVSRLRQDRRGQSVALRTLVQRRPKIARRLLQQKSKADYQRAAQQLAIDVEQALLLSFRQSDSNIKQYDGLTISELQSKFARHDGRYPSPTDVWVYIEHRCGTVFRIMPGDNDSSADASKDLTSGHQRICLLPKKETNE